MQAVIGKTQLLCCKTLSLFGCNACLTAMCRGKHGWSWQFAAMLSLAA